jgi:hypothetical protein
VADPWADLAASPAPTHAAPPSSDPWANLGQPRATILPAAAPAPVAKKVEQPKDATPSWLRELGEGVAAPASLLAAGWESIPALNAGPGVHPSGNHLARAVQLYRDAFAAAPKGEKLPAALHALNEAYDPFGDQSLSRQGINPEHVPAAVKFIGELGTSWYSPTNTLYSEAAKLGIQGAKAGVAGARAVSPAFDYLAQAAHAGASKAAQPVVAAGNKVADAASNALLQGARVAGRAFGGTQSGVRGLLDRYYAAGLPQKGGKTYTEAAFRAQAAPQRAEAEVVKQIRELHKDLTPAQKLEVQKLSYIDDATGQRIYTRDPNVPDPKKGKSLQDVADADRAMMNQWDVTQIGLGLRDPNKSELFASGEYWPMRKFNDRPVFQSQELEEASALGDELELQKVMAAKYGRGKGAFSTSVDKPNAKKYRTILEPGVEQDLHPEYDPIYQLEEHGKQTARAIANEQQRRMLEGVPSINPETGNQRTVNYPGFGERPAYARMQTLYGDLPSGGTPLVFGMDEAGKKARDKWVKEVIENRAAGEAVNDPRVLATAAKNNVNPATLGTKRIVKGMPMQGKLDEAVRSLTGFQRVAKAYADMGVGKVPARVRGIAKNVEASTGTAGDALYAASSLGKQAVEDARAAEERANLARNNAEYLEGLRDPNSAASKARTDQVARTLHADALEQYQQIAKTIKPGTLKPSWVWHDGKWQLAGEYEDVPKKFLDLKTKPKMPPVQTGQFLSRVDGDLDEKAAMLGMDESGVLDWMKNNGRQPRIVDFHDEALRRIQSDASQHERAIADARAEEAQLRAEATRLRKEASEHAAAVKNLGPYIREAEKTGTSSAKKLETVAQQVESASTRTAARAANVEMKQVARIKKISDDMLRRIQVSETENVYRSTMHEWYTKLYDELAPGLKERTQHAPQGYVKEEGSPSGRTMNIDEAWDNFLKGNENLTPREYNAAKGLWKGLETFNRLARLGIVLFPQVHAINNMGTQAMAEGVAPEDVARILSGRMQFDAGLQHRAIDAGAVSPWAHGAFGGDGFHATTDIGSRADMAASKAGSFARAARPLAAASMHVERGYDAMNNWLFQTVEQGYGFKLFDMYTKAGMSDAEAAIRVRNTLGRYDNISPREMALGLNRIFYFYPWMKTVVSYWAQKGVMDPKWWSAPVRAIQVSNEAQGYDDPSKPFTMTLGHRADGSWRRSILPLPQRVTEMLADTARLPVDVVTGNVDQATKDVKAPVNYVMGHANMIAGTTEDLIDYARHQGNVAPSNVFKSDSTASGPERVAQVAGNLSQRAIAPLSRIQDFTQDPVGAAAAYATGSWNYGVKTGAQKNKEKAIKDAINGLTHEAMAGAKASGNHALVLQLEKLRKDAFDQAMKQKPTAPLPVPSAAPAGADPWASL